MKSCRNNHGNTGSRSLNDNHTNWLNLISNMKEAFIFHPSPQTTKIHYMIWHVADLEYLWGIWNANNKNIDTHVGKQKKIWRMIYEQPIMGNLIAIYILVTYWCLIFSTKWQQQNWQNIQSRKLTEYTK